MIERRQAVPREEFFARYRDANRPLILADGMRNWPAMTRWNPDYLDQVCGGEIAQVMTGRDSDAEYEMRSDRRKTTMCFSDYVKKVKAAGQTNDFYLVAQNEFMRTDSARRLYR